jgi:hypothetical protein
MLSGANDTGNDQYAWDPTTSMSFSGYIAYGFMRHGANIAVFDDLIDINTSIGPSGVLDPNLATTFHYFYWDYGTLSWLYWDSREVGPESLTMPYGFPQVVVPIWISGQVEGLLQERLVDRAPQLSSHAAVFLANRGTQPGKAAYTR